MEKFSDFNMRYFDNENIETSYYFNRDMLLRHNKLASYFELYFAKGSVFTFINGYSNNYRFSNELYDKIFHEAIMLKISTMGEVMYDEIISHKLTAKRRDDNTDVEINHEENKKLFKFNLCCDLMVVYYHKLVHMFSLRKAEKQLEKLFYQSAIYWGVDGLLDEIICRGEEIKKENDTNESNGKVKNKGVFINPTKKEYETVYEYDDTIAKALFVTILSRSLNYVASNSVKEDIYSYFKNEKKYFNSRHWRKQSENFHLFEIIKQTTLKVNFLNIEPNFKRKIINSLQNILKDSALDKEKAFYNLKSALQYEDNNRPIYRCEELYEHYKNDYKFEGKVYHGFSRCDEYQTDPKVILQDYTNGFISCSKDITVATNFSQMRDIEDDRSHGFCGVIEITLSKEDTAIDIEQILTDQYNENQKLYGHLYESFIREKEVLIKLPLVSYRVLYPDEVYKIMKEQNKNKNNKEEVCL